MTIDRIILISIWVVSTVLMVIATPRNRIREAMVIFMFKQVLTWMLGIIVVEYKLLE
ncbi:hypothetical protein SAMN05518847_12019 [Paenibacillus sp. OV219]|nr:hypothetical protein SAMN05518847_12019 [Paenibacillus sp. OV219]